MRHRARRLCTAVFVTAMMLSAVFAMQAVQAASYHHFTQDPGFSTLTCGPNGNTWGCDQNTAYLGGGIYPYQYNGNWFLTAFYKSVNWNSEDAYSYAFEGCIPLSSHSDLWVSTQTANGPWNCPGGMQSWLGVPYYLDTSWYRTTAYVFHAGGFARVGLAVSFILTFPAGACHTKLPQYECSPTNTLEVRLLLAYTGVNNPACPDDDWNLHASTTDQWWTAQYAAPGCGVPDIGNTHVLSGVSLNPIFQRAAGGINQPLSGGYLTGFKVGVFGEESDSGTTFFDYADVYFYN